MCRLWSNAWVRRSWTLVTHPLELCLASPKGLLNTRCHGHLSRTHLNFVLQVPEIHAERGACSSSRVKSTTFTTNNLSSTIDSRVHSSRSGDGKLSDHISVLYVADYPKRVSLSEELTCHFLSANDRSAYPFLRNWLVTFWVQTTTSHRLPAFRVQSP